MAKEPNVDIEAVRKQLEELGKNLEGTDAGTHVAAALVMVERARHALKDSKQGRE